MHPLQQMFEDLGYETRSYSGRGMMGKECLGVCFDSTRDFNRSLAQIYEYAFEQGASTFEDGKEVEQNCQEIMNGLRQLSSDSLGMGMIYYFPGVPYESGEASSAEE